jgi:deoxyribonuclease-4
VTVLFGPSGNSQSFYDQGYKSSVDAPGWLKKMGLDAYEYSCTKGVNIKENTASDIGKQAAIHGILLSIHAPYYINMASPDAQKRENSIRYIMESLQAARWMGATRVVFHPGSCSRMKRDTAMEIALDTFERLLKEAKKGGFEDIALCPETLGKRNQLGSLEEVLDMCKLDPMVIPTIDIGHIHAFNNGGLIDDSDYQQVFETIERELGAERSRKLHIHYSRIEYTGSGEKRHRTYAETKFGPEFEPLARQLKAKGIDATIICESRGTMAEDAKLLKGLYNDILVQS